VDNFGQPDPDPDPYFQCGSGYEMVFPYGLVTSDMDPDLQGMASSGRIQILISTLSSWILIQI
jgi:hypothetical protein